VAVRFRDHKAGNAFWTVKRIPLKIVAFRYGEQNSKCFSDSETPSKKSEAFRSEIVAFPFVIRERNSKISKICITNLRWTKCLENHSNLQGAKQKSKASSKT